MENISCLCRRALRVCVCALMHAQLHVLTLCTRATSDAHGEEKDAGLAERSGNAQADGETETDCRIAMMLSVCVCTLYWLRDTQQYTMYRFII